MSSDRARISYDPKRQYRSVVAQQGRVTLEADVNEAQEIAGEALRLETIDVVGPAGTPDNGYEISDIPASTSQNFNIGKGTMYVGGERVSLPNNVTYSGQPEWMDHDGDPLWTADNAGANEFIYLLLREQEVSAVEDTALREVALGGPDTAQRKRLIQRIVRTPASADTCADSLKNAVAKWAKAGATFDAKSMMLTSSATLKVGLVNEPKQGNVCDPDAQGGYLGADNQLIRVQISAINGNRGKLLWGYNNASFLHRAKLSAPHSAELNFLTTPVDTYHAPRANHPIEVLRCALRLTDDLTIDVFMQDYVAAHTGVVVTPIEGPSDDLKSLTLPPGPPPPNPPPPNPPLPPNYSTNATPLFVRLWEEELSFTSGTPVTLTGTGLSVTIDLGNAAGDFTVGQYWTFAVRPNTPAEVYPHRYLLAPQPPEGPRMWACPLATIGWNQNKLSVLEDCRKVFDDLVTLTERHDGGCICSITAGPTDNLQGLINKIAPGADAHICLKTGTFALPATVKIEGKGHILLHGSGPGTKLVATKGESALQVIGCKSFTARDCAFEGGLVGDGNAGLARLNGALTVTDCPHVDASALALACAPGTKRSATGLTIYNREAAGTRAVVENCVVEAGHFQVGILAVNVETARILNNTVQPGGPLPASVSKMQRVAVSKVLLYDLQIAGKKPAGTTKTTPRINVTVGGNEFSFRPSLKISESIWQKFIKAAGPPTKMTAQAARRWLLKTVQSAVAKTARDSNPSTIMGRAIKLLLSTVTVTPSQGIVVAGDHIGDLTVAGNVVRRALQGIHIGTSHGGQAALHADRVYVTGNAVTVPLPLGTIARHGIFVGNCPSVQVTDNRIEGMTSSKTIETTVPEGIRIFGLLGRFAIVRANHITGLRTGIYFSPVGPLISQTTQWVITDNITESAVNMVLTPNNEVRNKIRGLANNCA